MKLTRLAIATTIALSIVPGLAAQKPEDHVVTLVVVKTPPGVSRAMIEAGFRQSVPTYQKVPGLVRKYFTVDGQGFGGVYYWINRAAADAWFNAAWHERVRKTYGVDGSVTFFDAPLAIEGMAATGAQ